MAVEPARRSEPPRGRRRDPSRSADILAATRELLMECGYDRFTVKDVATRCGSGLGTIYRRWPTKELLVADAIRSDDAQKYQRTGDAEEDLGALVASTALKASSTPDFVPGLVCAMRASREVDEAMRQTHTTSAFVDVLERVLGRDHPRLALLAEVAPAVIVYRTIFGGGVDAEGLVAEVLGLIGDVARAGAARPE